MTTLTDIFTQREEERLRTAFAAGKTPEAAVLQMQDCCERLLYAYNNESDISDHVKTSAANMLQSVRASMSLIDTAGDVRVWESPAPVESSVPDPSDKQAVKAARKAEKKAVRARRRAAFRTAAVRIMVVLLVLVGIFGMGAALYLVYYRHQDIMEWQTLLQPGAMLLSAGLSIFVAGVLFTMRKLPVIDEKTQRIEFFTDTEKLIAGFRTVLLLIDRSLERVSQEEQASRHRAAGEEGGMKAEEIDLFASLLEASYVEDAEFALERIADVRFYLHKQGIETVDYDEEHKEQFDLMPGEQTRTIRPALVRDGRLLKKGLASA